MPLWLICEGRQYKRLSTHHEPDDPERACRHDLLGLDAESVPVEQMHPAPVNLGHLGIAVVALRGLPPRDAASDDEPVPQRLVQGAMDSRFGVIDHTLPTTHDGIRPDRVRNLDRLP